MRCDPLIQIRKATTVVVIALTMSLTACGSSGSATSATPVPTAAPVIALANVTLVTPGTLTIGADIPYAPQEFYDSNHNVAGFDVEIGQAIATRLGLKATFVNQSFDQIIQALDAKKFDVILSAMTINPDRQAQVTFVPYFKAGTSFVVQTSSAFRPTTTADLCGHRVGLEIGTTEADIVTALDCHGNPPIVSTFSTDPEALQQLTLGKVDVLFTDSPPAAYYAAQSKGALIVSGGIINAAPEGIAIGKTRGPPCQ